MLIIIPIVIHSGCKCGPGSIEPIGASQRSSAPVGSPAKTSEQSNWAIAVFQTPKTIRHELMEYGGIVHLQHSKKLSPPSCGIQKAPDVLVVDKQFQEERQSATAQVCYDSVRDIHLRRSGFREKPARHLEQIYNRIYKGETRNFGRLQGLLLMGVLL